MPTFGFGSNEPNITPGGDRVGGFAQKIKELFADLYDKLNSVTWSNATQSSAGFMSVDDKKKLDCIYYGECSTAAATAAKVVTCAAFTLAAGSRVIVKFTVTNTAASPTLNVNSTGAKAIQYRGAAITAGYLAANRTYEFVYDGTNWQLVGDIDTNTDTHWTSHLYAGASNGTANAATTNGNTYLIICDNTTARDRRKIAGSGATTVTSDASGNITIASTNTTYSNFVKSGSGAKAGLVPSPGTTAGTTKYLREDATWQVPPNTVYTHPTTAGNKHIPAGGSSGQFLKYSAAGTAAWAADNNTTYSNMTAATTSAAGKAGLVPAPAKGDVARCLRADATFGYPSKLATARSITVRYYKAWVSGSGKISTSYEYGSSNFDGSGNITINLGCASGCATTCVSGCSGTCYSGCSGCTGSCLGSCSSGCSGDV